MSLIQQKPSSFSPIKNYNDSISKFDASADIYSTRATPMQQKRAAQLQKGKRIDSIETPTEKNDRINPVKVYPQVGGQALKIARAGRFIFFTVAAPPFFLVYTIPKFFAQKILPLMTPHLEKINFSLKQMFSHLNKMASNLVAPFRNIFGNIAWQLSKIEKQFNTLLNYMNGLMQKLSSGVSNSFKALGSPITDPIKKMTTSISRKLQDLAKESSKILSKVTESLQSTLHAVMQPVTHTLLPMFNNVAQSISKNLIQFRAKMSKNLKPFLKRCYNFASATASKAQQVIPQIIQLAQPVINVLIPTIQFLKKNMEYGLQWMNKKPKKGFQKFLAKGKSVYAKFSPVVHGCYDAIASKVKGFFFFILSFIARMIKKGIHLILSLHPSFQNKANQVKRFGIVVKNKSMQTTSLLKQRFSKTITFIANQFKKFIEAPIDYVLGLLKIGLRYMMKTMKFVALVFIAIILVFKYWFQMLFELSEQVSSNFVKAK